MNSGHHPGFQAIQNLLAPIIRWCVSVGIGHGQLNRLSKPLFYEAARQELHSKGHKLTDSAVSLASGLHKGDIERFNTLGSVSDELTRASIRFDRINPASQVIARWMSLGLDRCLPLRGSFNSFEALVKATQYEGAPLLSTRLILKELERRQLVIMDEEQRVHLQSEVGLPEIDQEEAVKHFVGAVRDHMLACLENLEAKSDEARYLEQSINIDGLKPQSIALIHQAAREWWAIALKDLTAKAIALSEADEPNGGNQRMRLGIYAYSQQMQLPLTGHSVHPSLKK